LGEVEAAALRDHLASCPDCTRLLLSLAAFESAGEGPVDLAAAREARLMARTIVAQERARRWRAITSVAAGLTLLGLGLFLFRELAVRDRASRLSRFDPGAENVNLPLVSLHPEGTLRARGEPERLAIPPRARVVALLLATREPPGSGACRLEVRESGGGLLLARDGLVPTKQGTFELWLPAEALPAGVYQVLLHGPAPDGERLLETYVLEVEHAAGEPGSRSTGPSRTGER
jgi:hypothetical protein